MLLRCLAAGRAFVGTERWRLGPGPSSCPRDTGVHRLGVLRSAEYGVGNILPWKDATNQRVEVAWSVLVCVA